jgi:hypothetical protein
MDAPDLRVEPPRRWTEELGGTRWLPRLIDKARAARAGTLGAYLYGQSPLDNELLHILDQSYRSFSTLVAQAPDDDAVLAELRAHDPDAIERAQRWGASLHERRLYTFALDLDDGRFAGWRWLKPAVNGVSFVLVAVVRRIWPSPSEATSRAARSGTA